MLHPKNLLFSKSLEGCYSVSNGHAAFKPGQLPSFSELFAMALVSDLKVAESQQPSMRQLTFSLIHTSSQQRHPQQMGIPHCP